MPAADANGVFHDGRYIKPLKVREPRKVTRGRFKKRSLAFRQPSKDEAFMSLRNGTTRWMKMMASVATITREDDLPEEGGLDGDDGDTSSHPDSAQIVTRTCDKKDERQNAPCSRQRSYGKRLGTQRLGFYDGAISRNGITMAAGRHLHRNGSRT
ncbi:hypothetical protein ZHAS_00018126 [Anopheles sinensis]|uniref:Uncharacterized protein n=1 Tax=Anopheles sinensis TaxID=74873 RepID=A0A084WHK0_ANOSI|nr:hypothetical protein ZHAS_00018126 [Anopheles sinensis]